MFVQGDDLVVGTTFKWPGRETAPVDERPEWPKEITVRRFTTAEIEKWKISRKVPNRGKSSLLLASGL
jgi:hypothetical protein